MFKEGGSFIPEIQFENLNVDFKNAIGHRAYDTVYRGSWVGTEVAVKIIKQASTYKDEVLREARLHASLRHPNIVIFMGISSRKRDVALVTELVIGISMQYYIDEEITLSDEHKTVVIFDVFKGTAYLHEVSVVHGDVKPGNILISNQMHAKFCDFGLGKLKQKLAVTGSVTLDGSLHGTITFLPLECLLHNKRSTFSSDI